MREHVEALWALYRDHVVPDGADMTQLAETRRAFFAGAVGVFKLLTEAVSSGDDVTDADLNLMAELEAELLRFNISQGVKLG